MTRSGGSDIRLPKYLQILQLLQKEFCKLNRSQYLMQIFKKKTFKILEGSKEKGNNQNVRMFIQFPGVCFKPIKMNREKVQLVKFHRSDKKVDRKFSLFIHFISKKQLVAICGHQLFIHTLYGCKISKMIPFNYICKIVKTS